VRGSGPLAATLALAVGLTVVAFVFIPHAGQVGDVPVVTVARAPFVQEVAAEGSLQAVHSIPLAVPDSGVEDSMIVSWLAADGTRVRAGDPVARFDPRLFRNSLRASQDALATDRILAAKERAQSAADLDKLKGDGEVADLELDAARRFQKKDATIFSRAERIESEIDGELAGERAGHAAAARRTRGAISKAERELIEIQSRQAAAGIARAERGLRSLTLTAPRDGVVLLRRSTRREPVRVGDNVWPGEPLAELPDLASFAAEVYVLEADAGGLVVGKPATVSLEASPGVSYPATVSRVDTLAKPRFRGSPVQYFAVTLALGRTDPARMKPGARVTARLTLDRLDAALAVPREAVFERDGRSVVYRRRDGGFEPVAVALGPVGMGRVVIRSGIAAGDVLALRDPTRPAAPPGAQPGAAPGADAATGSLGRGAAARSQAARPAP
jgi:HlyD family secretion protein